MNFIGAGLLVSRDIKLWRRRRRVTLGVFVYIPDEVCVESWAGASTPVTASRPALLAEYTEEPGGCIREAAEPMLMLLLASDG